jgi:hypothetical protein
MKVRTGSPDFWRARYTPSLSSLFQENRFLMATVTFPQADIVEVPEAFQNIKG